MTALSPAEVLASATTAGAALELRRIFSNLNETSCPDTYNFHMHTTCSDGRLTPEQLMEQAVDLNLKGLAITDHHTVQAYYRARQWMEDWRWRHPAAVPVGSQVGHPGDNPLPRLWIGAEINAILLETEVHILGYAFRPEHPYMQAYLQPGGAQGSLRQAEQVIKAIQLAGGLAILAHPARYRRPVQALVQAASNLGIDGIETYYAYDNPDPWRPSPEVTYEIRELADQYRLLSTCGTDSHGLSLLRRI